MTQQSQVRKSAQDNMSLGVGTTPHHVDFTITTGTQSATWQIKFYDYNYQLITDPVHFTAWAVTAVTSYLPDTGDLTSISPSGTNTRTLYTNADWMYTEAVTCANGTGSIVLSQGGGGLFTLCVWPEGCDKFFISTASQTIAG